MGSTVLNVAVTGSTDRLPSAGVLSFEFVCQPSLLMGTLQD